MPGGRCGPCPNGVRRTVSLPWPERLISCRRPGWSRAPANRAVGRRPPNGGGQGTGLGGLKSTSGGFGTTTWVGVGTRSGSRSTSCWNTTNAAAARRPTTTRTLRMGQRYGTTERDPDRPPADGVGGRGRPSVSRPATYGTVVATGPPVRPRRAGKIAGPTPVGRPSGRRAHHVRGLAGSARAGRLRAPAQPPDRDTGGNRHAHPSEKEHTKHRNTLRQVSQQKPSSDRVIFGWLRRPKLPSQCGGRVSVPWRATMEDVNRLETLSHRRGRSAGR